jgi:hypothetical protein
MATEEIENLIRERSLLPSPKRHQLLGGMGEGKSCSACGKPITPQQVQCDVDLGIDAAPLALHISCYGAWCRAETQPVS